MFLCRAFLPPSLFCLLCLHLVSPVLGGVHELWWDLTYVENANPDGLFERRVIGVNGTWPYVSLFSSK